MTNFVFDSNLKLLGNNIAKCHQLISDALKVSDVEQNENACNNRIRRLCTSEAEKRALKGVTNDKSALKPSTGRTAINSISRQKSNTNLRTVHKSNKGNNGIINGRKTNRVISSSNDWRACEKSSVFDMKKNKNMKMGTTTKSHLNPTSTTSSTTSSKFVKPKPDERQRVWSRNLTEQNDARSKHYGSETDVNPNVYEQAGKSQTPTGSVSYHQIVDSNLPNRIKDTGDMVQFINRSTQCSNNEEFVQPNTNFDNMNEKSASTFSIFNPVRTLHFLMQELQGKIVDLRDKNIKRIIMDMEDTLLRLPASCNSNPPPPVISTLTAENLDDVDFYQHEAPEKLSNLPSYKQEWKKKGSGSDGVARSENLQMKLELSCSKLEKACEQMEKACCQLKKERDYLKIELCKKNKSYDELAKKETAYLETINDLKENLKMMTNKADEHTKSIENLNSVLNQLQEENKVVSALKDLHKKLNMRLRETAQENERLTSDLELISLEREKLALLLQSRDEELSKLQKDFCEVQEFVSDQLMNTSMRKDPSYLNCNFSLLSIDSSHEKEKTDAEPNNLTNSKSSNVFRNSIPSGWHVMNSGATDSSLALKSASRTSNNSRKEDVNAANLIDSIRTLLSEMKNEPVIDLVETIPSYNTIETYIVPQISDTSISSQKSLNNYSQISSLSTLTL